MKLVSFSPDKGDSRPGMLSESDEVHDLTATSLVDGERAPLANAIEQVCADGTATLDSIDAPTYELDAVSIATPVPADARVICLGGVYTQHLEERGDSLTRVPSQWIAPDRAVVGPGDTVGLPERVSHRVVPAVELGVVIGSQCRYLDEAAVFDHIAGYTVCNDVTARTDWPGPMAYKLMEGFWPTGPSITPAEEVQNPAALDMSVDVDGESICKGTTASMRFSLPFIVSYLSQILEFRPGDIISTGDPGGVSGRMQPGKNVTVAIESVGTLTNRVVEK